MIDTTTKAPPASKAPAARRGVASAEMCRQQSADAKAAMLAEGLGGAPKKKRPTKRRK